MKKFKIFAHRGLWRTKKDENSLTAFSKALEKGYDIEADLRFYNSNFIIKRIINIIIYTINYIYVIFHW